MSALCLWAGSMLAGCAAEDHVLFVTTTTIGLDADTRPPNASIGYDRYEGYIGPAYSTGAVPPVFAKIESNLKIFEPEVRQLYATGDAAILVTAADPGAVPIAPKPMFTDSREPMFFGTSANIGLRVTFTGEVPESINLGYKRKEFSFIPLGSEMQPDGRAVDKYASVMAAIDMGVEIPGFRDAGLGVSQFFATGQAADNLARRQVIRDRFALEAATAISDHAVRVSVTESGRRLAERAVADDTFATRLRAWMTSQNIGVTMTEFLYGESFEQQRQAAIAALAP